MTVDPIIGTLISVVIVAIVFVIEMILNLKRSRRCMQVAVPTAAGIYGGLAIIAVCVLGKYIKLLCNNIGLSGGGYIAVSNFIVLIGWLIVKAACLGAAKVTYSKPERIQAKAGKYYELDASSNTWYMKPEWYNYSRVCLVIAIFGAAISGIVIGIVWGASAESGLGLFMFPGVISMIFCELYCFLNGELGDPGKIGNRYGGRESVSVAVRRYFKLREILEGLFPNVVLSANTGCDFISAEGATNTVKALAASEDRIDNIVADHFDVKDKKRHYDPDFILAASKLMHGKSVVFFDPFYRDLGDYISLPLTNALLSDKHCLIITSRSSTTEDVSGWIGDILQKYARIHSLWKISELTDEAVECDVGILTFSRLYDLNVLNANRRFFRESSFVLIIEPSLMVNTGQLGLSMIADELASPGEPPVYCVCDRKTNGLVDTLSHVLRTELVEVSATPIPRSMYTGMCWDADGDFERQRLFEKQTKYLGNGIEISAVAIKNQIPKVTWYSETKTPVRDIKWIAGQFYPMICKYMNLPAQQKSINEKIKFVSNLWCAPSSKEQFIIVEDEFCNMFSTMSMFLSRNSKQIFVNVLSENYLLRDYMRYNRQMFTSDPNAIPSLVPDYSKTERNTTIKLILTMSYRPVSEAEVVHELGLIGIETDDVFSTLTKLIRRYTNADDSLLTVRNLIKDYDDGTFTHDTYSISRSAFEFFFADTLRNAYYVVEDEKGDTEYLDAKLFCHVPQCILPGQFVTYQGKYYYVKLISPLTGVVLRRASDLYESRHYYRQQRTYALEPAEGDCLVRTRKVTDVELTVERRCFSVTTNGYYDLSDNSDAAGGRFVDLRGDPVCGTLHREYKNKDVLKIGFPNMSSDEKLTLCILLSESFRSVFPDAWQYIAVMCGDEKLEGDYLGRLTYELKGSFDDDYIYIIEDSTMDLGLLEAIEKKFSSIMEMITDYLKWHFEKLAEPPEEPPVMGEVTLPKAEPPEEGANGGKGGKKHRLRDFFRKLFGGKKKDGDTPETGEQPPQGPDTPEPGKSEYLADSPSEGAKGGKDEKDDGFKDNDPDDGADIPGDIPCDVPETEDGEIPEDGTEDGSDPEDEPEAPVVNEKYRSGCYLNFGFDEIDPRLALEGLRDYLSGFGWDENDLEKARKRKPLDVPDSLEDENCCDFCARPLSGVCYDLLDDGRVRCNDCSATAINTVEEFRELFDRCVEMMSGIFGIEYRTPIDVVMTDSATIAAQMGRVFIPTTEYTARVVGYAMSAGGQYTIVIENGSPRLACINTIVHEMTHIWQYSNWKAADIIAMYGPGNRELVYEGMAMWAAIQYLYQIGETYYAMIQELNCERRDDAYGAGFRYYRSKYPLMKDCVPIKFSPFKTFPPL